jgi:hypothetical protein
MLEDPPAALSMGGTRRQVTADRLREAPDSDGVVGT